MIKRIYVNNYKTLVNFEMKFDEFTLLVGKNGSGKSSILDIFYGLRQLLNGEATITDVFPRETLTRWQMQNIQTIELEVEIDRVPLVYRLDIDHAKDLNRSRISLEHLKSSTGDIFKCEKGQVSLFRDDHSMAAKFGADWSESALARVFSPEANKALHQFLNFMQTPFICRINPYSLQAEAKNDDEILALDASNFTAWYRHVSHEYQGFSFSYITALKEVIEGLSSISLKRVGEKTRLFQLEFRSDENGKYELGLDEISDGQRALVLLYALLHIAVNRGFMLIIDEPENFLALSEIQPWISELLDAASDKKSQVIFTSHHPELINYLGVEYGVNLFRESAGATRHKRLSDCLQDFDLPAAEVIARGWES